MTFGVNLEPGTTIYDKFAVPSRVVKEDRSEVIKQDQHPTSTTVTATPRGISHQDTSLPLSSNKMVDVFAMPPEAFEMDDPIYCGSKGELPTKLHPSRDGEYILLSESCVTLPSLNKMRAREVKLGNFIGQEGDLIFYTETNALTVYDKKSAESFQISFSTFNNGRPIACKYLGNNKVMIVFDNCRFTVKLDNRGFSVCSCACLLEGAKIATESFHCEETDESKLVIVSLERSMKSALNTNNHFEIREDKIFLVKDRDLFCNEVREHLINLNWCFDADFPVKLVDHIEGWTIVGEAAPEGKKWTNIRYVLNSTGKIEYTFKPTDQVRCAKIFSDVLVYAPSTELKLYMMQLDKFGKKAVHCFFELDLSKFLSEKDGFIVDVAYDAAEGVGYCLILYALGYRVVRFKKKPNLEVAIYFV